MTEPFLDIGYVVRHRSSNWIVIDKTPCYVEISTILSEKAGQGVWVGRDEVSTTSVTPADLLPGTHVTVDGSGHKGTIESVLVPETESQLLYTVRIAPDTVITGLTRDKLLRPTNPMPEAEAEERRVYYPKFGLHERVSYQPDGFNDPNNRKHGTITSVIMTTHAGAPDCTYGISLDDGKRVYDLGNKLTTLDYPMRKRAPELLAEQIGQLKVMAEELEDIRRDLDYGLDG